MCKWGTYEEVKVRIPKSLSCTGRSHLRKMKIDKCIAPLVRILNDYGIETISSCCGHGKVPHSYIRINSKNVELIPLGEDLTIHLKFPYQGGNKIPPMVRPVKKLK